MNGDRAWQAVYVAVIDIAGFVADLKDGTHPSIDTKIVPVYSG